MFKFSRFGRGLRKSREFGPRENFPLYGMWWGRTRISLPSASCETSWQSHKWHPFPMSSPSNPHSCLNVVISASHMPRGGYSEALHYTCSYVQMWEVVWDTFYWLLHKFLDFIHTWRIHRLIDWANQLTPTFLTVAGQRTIPDKKRTPAIIIQWN